MSGKYSHRRPVHVGRALTDLQELFEYPCGVNVYDQELVGAFARLICGDDAVDVLRGREQERDVLLPLDRLKDLVFNRLFGRKQIVAPMQHGAFEEEHIDVANRALYEIVEKL